jgi:hypothetical protein
MTSFPLKGDAGGEEELPFPISRFREPPLNIALMSSQAKTMIYTGHKVHMLTNLGMAQISIML